MGIKINQGRLLFKIFYLNYLYKEVCYEVCLPGSDL